MPAPAEDRVTLSQAGAGPAPATDPAGTLVEVLRAAIAGAGDPERAPQMQRYMKSAMPFRGVGMGPLRLVCRSAMNAHRLPDRASWEAAVLGLWDGAAYREERYAAVILTGHRYYREHQDPAGLELYRHLVVTGAWWDLVDDVAANRVGVILRGAPHEVTPTIRAWARDEHLWLRRTAVLAQLGSKRLTDTDLLAEVLDANLEGTLHGSDFFIRKAVGWALRQHARTDERWVVRYVEDRRDRLSGLSVREALKHVVR